MLTTVGVGLFNTCETGDRDPSSALLILQNSHRFFPILQHSELAITPRNTETQNYYKYHSIYMQELSMQPKFFRDINLKAWTNSLGFPLSCSFLKSIFVNHVSGFQGNQVDNTSCKQPPSIYFSWLQGSQKLSVWQRKEVTLFLTSAEKNISLQKQLKQRTQQASTEISVDFAIWSSCIITLAFTQLFYTFFPVIDLKVPRVKSTTFILHVQKWCTSLTTSKSSASTPPMEVWTYPTTLSKNILCISW